MEAHWNGETCSEEASTSILRCTSVSFASQTSFSVPGTALLLDRFDVSALTPLVKIWRLLIGGKTLTINSPGPLYCDPTVERRKGFLASKGPTNLSAPPRFTTHHRVCYPLPEREVGYVPARQQTAICDCCWTSRRSIPYWMCGPPPSQACHPPQFCRP